MSKLQTTSRVQKHVFRHGPSISTVKLEFGMYLISFLFGFSIQNTLKGSKTSKIVIL